MVKSSHALIFNCYNDNNHSVQSSIQLIAEELMNWNKLVRIINMEKNITLKDILKVQSPHRTTIIMDCNCNGSQSMIREASETRYFNKTYQWLLFEYENNCYNYLSQPDIRYFGPNAQIILVRIFNKQYELWDLHTKGHHLKNPIENYLIGIGNIIEKTSLQKSDIKLKLLIDINDVQSIWYRGNFYGITLRGATVIDQDDVTNNEKIDQILSGTSKDLGVSAFTKYHYEILRIASNRLNFTVNFRNARVWSGHLLNTSFRLGYLGIMKRNEADVGGSGTFNRLHRFVHFDILHSSWKFETAFLFLYSPHLTSQTKKGNFLAPFEQSVWIVIPIVLLNIIIIWYIVEYIKITYSQYEQEHRFSNNLLKRDYKSIIPLHIIAAMCQQGLDPIPLGVASRVIALTSFIFSLLIYNYYTSSVVGGLLSNTARGPSTVDEIIASPLRLSFEDIGYHTVLFRESKLPMVRKVVEKKILPPRPSSDLPVYSQLETAIPYIRRGDHAFHCEVSEAYPRIAQLFDVTEICNLRAVSGLLDTQLMNWIIDKNSQYTEILRIVSVQITEVGLIKRLLWERQKKKPQCMGMYIVHPVSISGILAGFSLLAGGMTIALVVLILEKIWSTYM